jgi:hypothetical protein
MTSSIVQAHPAAEQVSATFAAEILPDAATGRPELVISTGSLLYEAVSISRARAEIAAARLQLDRAEALVTQYEDGEKLRVFLAEHDARMFEADNVGGSWLGRIDGVLNFLFPADMSAAARLTLARDYLGLMGRAA